MLINLRNALMASKRTPTAKDYVQDGLIAMWDGIENAGWGVHDPNATTWKDLSGNNNDLVLQNGAHFDANSLVTARRNKVSAVFSPNAYLAYNTLEACAFWDETRNPSALICFGNSIQQNRMLSATKERIQVCSGNYDYPIPTDLQSVRNTWAATYDGKAQSPFVSGTLIQSTPSTNNWSYQNHPFGLSGASNYQNYNFIGNYYCVRVYDRALTADEIAANYAIDKARFNLP